MGLKAEFFLPAEAAVSAALPRKRRRLTLRADTTQAPRRCRLLILPSAADHLRHQIRTRTAPSASLRTGEAAIPTRLSHHRGVFGFDFVEDADFAGLAVGIFVYAEIFLGQLVDAFGGAFFG